MDENKTLMDLARVLTDVFDDMHDGMTRLIAMTDKYKEKLDAFNDIEIYDQDAIAKMLEDLPPNRAAAFVLALVDMSDMVSDMAPDEQTVKENAKLVADYMETLDRVRTNLHQVVGDEK